VWEFLTPAAMTAPRASAQDLGLRLVQTGGGGGWMAGSYDPRATRCGGNRQPGALYDWAGDKWMTEGPRPGITCTPRRSSCSIPNRKLKNYFQVLPHDAWDFDPAQGELMMIERDGKKYVVHPSKNGFVYVFDRMPASRSNVYKGVMRSLRQGHQAQRRTGRTLGSAEGKHKNLCPAIAGGYSWNAGSYSPKTGLLYKVGFEWCMDLDS